MDAIAAAVSRFFIFFPLLMSLTLRGILSDCRQAQASILRTETGKNTGAALLHKIYQSRFDMTSNPVPLRRAGFDRTLKLVLLNKS